MSESCSVSRYEIVPRREWSQWCSRSQAAQRLMDGHHSTLHAFFLAAKESGCTEFRLQLVASPKDRVELCISPREHSEMSAKFDVRGNMVRAVLCEASVVPADKTDVGINYGGTRSGEVPVRVLPGARSSPPRRPAAVTCRDPQKMDWTPWSL
jgi:hypothetical protein